MKQATISEPIPEIVSCKAQATTDGWVVATVRIPPDIARRLKNKAFQQDLGAFLNDNIFRRAIETSVY